MSLLPLLFSNWWEELEQPHRIMDQHFGGGLHPENLLSPGMSQLYAILPPRERSSKCPMAAYYRPWGDLVRKSQGGSSTVKANKDQFQVVLDVQQFSPEEIQVKVVDRYVIVEGKHEEKQDEHGFVSRQFTRKYMIPEQCDIDQVSSKLSSDGVLSISVPRKPREVGEGERMINIECTGKPAVHDESDERKKKKTEGDEENAEAN